MRWREAGIGNGLLVTPEVWTSRAPMNPASIGQALSALPNGTLTAAWRNSGKLGLDVREL